MSRKKREDIFHIFYRATRDLFPKDVRQDIHDLYVFIHTIQDYAHEKPPAREKYLTLKKNTLDALDRRKTDSKIAREFAAVAIKYKFAPEWLDLFFSQLEKDMEGIPCATRQDTEEYLKGNAEVPGRMMARILDFPYVAVAYARYLARVMRFASLIRDAASDAQRGLLRLPQEELHAMGLSSLTKEEAYAHPREFAEFMRKQIALYKKTDTRVRAGLVFMPYSSRVAVATVADMYSWTMKKIEEDPFVIFLRRLEPSPARIFFRAVWNAAAYMKRQIK